MATFRSYKEKDDDYKSRGAGQAESAPLTGAGSGGGGGGNMAAAEDYTKSSFVSGKSLLDANKNAAQTNLTGAFNKVADDSLGSLNTQKADYDKTLGDYKSGATIGDDVYKGALSGDTTAAQRVKNVIYGQEAAPDKFNARSGLDISDVNRLNTATGVQGLLSKSEADRGNYNYGSGQAALDAAIFGRSDARAQQVQDSLGKYRDGIGQYDQTNQDMAGNLGQAQDFREAQRGVLTNHLSADQAALAKAAEQRTTQLNQGVKANQSQAGNTAYAKSASDKIIQNILGGMTDADLKARLSPQLSGLSGSQLSDFVNQGLYGSPQYTADEAARYGNISGLLNSNKSVTPNAARAADTFNEQAFRDVLSKNYIDPTSTALTSEREAEAYRRKVAEDEAAARQRDKDRRSDTLAGKIGESGKGIIQGADDAGTFGGPIQGPGNGGYTPGVSEIVDAGKAVGGAVSKGGKSLAKKLGFG